MPNLLRTPLPWMVLAECAVVAAFVFVAWHLVASPPIPPPTPPAATSPRADSGDALSVLPGATGQPARGQGPGLNRAATFWRLRLAELNRGQAAFEALEWRLVRSAMDAAHRYVESVVLPSVARAEHHPRRPR